VDKISEIEQAIKPVLTQNRFELIETQYRREDGRWVVRLFIDKSEDSGQAGGRVTLDDCARVSDLAGDALDTVNVVDSRYVLEVSSPGVNRPLKTEAHFKKAVGQPVKVSTYAPVAEGSLQKNFKGELVGFQNETLEVEDITSGRVSIPLPAVAKANLDLI